TRRYAEGNGAIVHRPCRSKRRVGVWPEAAEGICVGREEGHALCHRFLKAANGMRQMRGEVALTCEQVAARVISERDMNMHAAVRKLRIWLCHEGRGEAVAVCHAFHKALVENGIIGSAHGVLAMFQHDLELAG